ncbi:GNAT family N-acetyltransferase [Paenibacillus protaetiae]|uniref:N-acetyltransferase n=1 Tax=Paenibacillus protaetiae TaxID=2509456 RepID=A0A4P6EVU8_9BACL|nr:GNAT family N-acetyltransferase [Paenibacillus protaetiae]QAY67172.1 N-acetyltransferase [Paenibacillus protaetiae]
MNEEKRQEEQTEISTRKQDGRVELVGAGGVIGEMTFRPADGDTWVIDHTYVDPKYRGKQLAKQLLNLVTDEARAQGKKIIPLCSYALAEFKRHAKEYEDLWDKSGV